MKKENFKERNGITLIALVITIVVLLILVGVSKAMLTGDNGILTQAILTGKEYVASLDETSFTTKEGHKILYSEIYTVSTPPEGGDTAVVGEIVTETAYTDSGYLPEGIQPENDTAEANEEAERDAVVSAGGFYIGRYEAGDSSASDHRSSSTVTDTTVGTLVSKKNVYAYSYIAKKI